MRALCLAAITATAFALVGCGGDASSPATAPPGGFAVTATVGGVPVVGFSAVSGATATLNVGTGQAVQLLATGSVNWATTLNGTDLVAGPSNATQWSGAFGTPTARSVVLTAASTADATRVAVININVAAGPSYAFPSPQLGNATTFAVSDVFVNGVTTSSSYTDTVTAVNANGSHTVQRQGGDAPRLLSMTATGARAAQTFTVNGNSCSYTPPRVVFDFPLHFGKSWSSAWAYQCQLGYRENGALSGRVVAIERVTVPAGTFDALRIALTFNYTNSNDANLVGGTAGTAQYRIDSVCWYTTAAPLRFLGCDDSYTYTGSAPANYLRTTSYKRSTP